MLQINKMQILELCNSIEVYVRKCWVPRSNPATYTGLFDSIRDLFSQVPEAKMRGYKPEGSALM